MKNLVKLFAVVLVFGITVASCQKDEDVTNLEAKKGQVSINLSTDQMNASMASPMKSSVQRPESFPVFIDNMTITATAAAGVVSKDFQFADTGEEGISMSPYLGQNRFDVETQINNAKLFPLPSGFHAASFSYGEENPLTSVASKVEEYRGYSPYVAFSGIANGLVTETPSMVNVDMETLQGRLIVSMELFETEASPMMKKYSIKAKMTSDDEANQSAVFGYVDNGNGTYNKRFGMLYLSNERCVDNKAVSLIVEIRELQENGASVLLKTVNLTETQAKNLEIIPGRDRYTKMQISADGQVFISSASFTFTWDWDTQDDDITIE